MGSRLTYETILAQGAFSEVSWLTGASDSLGQRQLLLLILASRVGEIVTDGEENCGQALYSAYQFY